ncbi:MAG: TonB-linked SusC/RagA family outer membrane protein [Limisphaerales bacterium]|jgi:TonB-linked SusC/RagA family outer membrane protein
MRRHILLMITVLMISATAFAQTRTISGTITSDDGETLPGAAVIVKGTNIGTITDIDGQFVISVPEGNDVLTFTYIGMKNQDIAIGSSNSLNITLEQDLVQLDKVLITALGIAKKEKALGYSAQNVSGDEISGSGEVNAIQGLAGKVAGVQIIGSAGVPGASSKIILRGNATFTGENQPLIVVDGVPIDNDTRSSIAGDYPFNQGLSSVNFSNRGIDINPDDIESVTVLKGPVAAAQYGVRAANGAIVYTTKRGTRGKKKGLNMEFSYTLDISEVNKLPDLQSTYAQGTGGGTFEADGTYNEGTYNVGDSGPDGIWFTDDDVSTGTSASWGPAISTLDGVSTTDNVDQFFETGISHNLGLSLSGGSENAFYRFSASHTEQEGIVPNTDFGRTSLSMSANADLSDNVKIDGKMTYIKSGGTRAQNGSNLSGVMLSLTRAPASYDLLGGNGPNGYDLANGLQHQYFFPYDNPHWSAYNSPFTDNVNRLIGNFGITYDPTDWLTFSYRLGTDVYSDSRKQIFSIGAWDPPAPTGEIWENTLNYRQIYGDLFVTGRHTFSDKFSGTLSVGNNVWQESVGDVYSRGRNLTIPNFYNLSNATDLYASEATEFERSTAIFGIMDLAYNDLIYLNANVRNEWSSTFGSEKSSFLFGGVNASFVFSELLDESDVFNFGKFRIGYASVGLAPPVYSSINYFGQQTFTDGFTNGLNFPYLGVNGFGFNNTLGNPGLAPERTNGIELGFDLRFFTGRLNIDATYYVQKTTDILLPRPIAATTGYTALFDNAGEMNNKGIELVISGDPVRTGKFNWNISANFARNVNEVTTLAEGVDELDLEAAFSSIGSYAIVGEPYGLMYGTNWDYSAEGDLVIGTNGIPLVDDLRQGIGNPYPDWTLGLRNSFTFSGLTVSALLDVREGGDIWCGTCARLNQLGRTEASADRERTYIVEGMAWNPTGGPNGDGFDADGNPVSTGVANAVEVDAYDYYRSYLGDGPGSAVAQNIHDGSWIRLRDVSIGYDFNIGSDVPVLRDLSLTVTGRNLWLKTDYPGVDPETSLTGAGSNVGGFDYFNMPGTKSYMISIRAKF